MKKMQINLKNEIKLYLADIDLMDDDQIDMTWLELTQTPESRTILVFGTPFHFERFINACIPGDPVCMHFFSTKISMSAIPQASRILFGKDHSCGVSVISINEIVSSPYKTIIDFESNFSHESQSGIRQIIQNPLSLNNTQLGSLISWDKTQFCERVSADIRPADLLLCFERTFFNHASAGGGKNWIGGYYLPGLEKSAKEASLLIENARSEDVRKFMSEKVNAIGIYKRIFDRARTAQDHESISYLMSFFSAYFLSCSKYTLMHDRDWSISLVYLVRSIEEYCRAQLLLTGDVQLLPSGKIRHRDKNISGAGQYLSVLTDAMKHQVDTEDRYVADIREAIDTRNNLKLAHGLSYAKEDKVKALVESSYHFFKLFENYNNTSYFAILSKISPIDDQYIRMEIARCLDKSLLESRL
ncbi:hypothetical protein [Alcanivorax sp. 1008]|uniref:hypothetical protein n=1 Tax=Alcanivorax sp. 1008 TaxID=2816853 RepID=UPI001D93EBC6|nr:hypothetical protein [Alcanivorax sp. 1008]MCC1498180.1 hypothetical protein [Alcanivorax sp. 1008]